MIRIALRTTSGRYLVAEDARTRFKLGANAEGVGDWEVFNVSRADGRTVESLESGDAIRLQTAHGRFLMARNAGGADVNGEPYVPSTWETFTIEKLIGSGPIEHGDAVVLRTENGRNFLMADNGGGAGVTATSTNRSVWETFTLEYWNPLLVRLKSHDGHYVAAENGGGGAINANRGAGDAWETFSLVNRTRRVGFVDGDKVALRAWNGKFVSATGGGGAALRADRNRAERFETFTIRKRGGGAIAMTDAVGLRTPNESTYVIADGGGGGVVEANSLQFAEWESFGLEPAEANPIAFASAPSAAPIPGHPMARPPARVAGSRRLLSFLIGFEDKRVDDTITQTVFRDFLHRGAGSVREWVERMSFGAFTIVDAGTFAPLTVPWRYGERENQDYFSGLLRLAERQGYSFRSADTNGNGVITGEELLFVVVDCTDLYAGGQKRPIDFTHDGVRYTGCVYTVGINTRGGSPQGRAQLDGVFGTICHELSHMLFDLPDRYYQAYPPRGDVAATALWRREWERFALVPSTATTEIRDGTRVRLRVPDGGDHLAIDATRGRFLNRGADARDAQGEFVIEHATSGGIVNHGDRVYLKSLANNRYLMAANGGGNVVQALAERPSTWETFIIENDGPAGPIRPNQPVTLKTLSTNLFDRGFYLSAAPNGRRTDPETLARGWWSRWEDSPPGLGAGGAYDVMDNDKKPGGMSLYDRIKHGWVAPRVLTPADRAAYVLRPSFDHPEGFVLWDPLYPDEWYVLDNRQQRAGFDHVPSGGLIVSWVNDNPRYWSNWQISGSTQSPAVISAAAPNVPPNAMHTMLMVRDAYFRRQDPDTAFRDAMVTLPRGDGSPSRFRLRVQPSAGESIVFSIL